MSTHDASSGRQPGEPDPETGTPASDQATRWTAPSGPAVSPLPPVGPSAAYETAPGNPRGVRRWLLPLVGVVLLALIVGALVFVVLSMQPVANAGQTRAGYAYVPDRAMMAMELRLDLPGDQRQQLFGFVSRFPKMGDAAAVEARMTQLLDEVVGDITGGSGNFRDDVEPWFEGWAVVGAQVPEDLMAGADGAVVAALGSKDRDQASQAMIRLRPAGDWAAQAGPGGYEIWAAADRFGDGEAMAYAVTDDAVIVGAAAQDVRRALDVKAGNAPSLLEVSRFNDALGRQPESRLAMFWIDAEALEKSLGSMPGGAMGSPFQCDQVPQPRGMAGSLYMRDGQTMMDVLLEMPEGSEMPAQRDSGLAQQMPSDTVLYFETRDLGDSVTKSLSCLRDDPFMGRQLSDIEEGMGQRIDDLISWAGDTAVGIRYDGARATGGLVIRVTDQARAAESMGQLRAAITSMGGGEINVREEEYNGARMVTFDLGAEFDDMAEPPLPGASLAYAFKDDLLVVGVDASFTRAVIDAQAGNSLASTDRYRRAIEAAGGASNVGQAYVSIAGASTLLDSVMGVLDPVTGGAMDEEMRDVRDVIAALDSLALVATVDGNTTVTKVVLSTREP